MTKTILTGAALALSLFSGTAFSAGSGNGVPSGTVCSSSGSCGNNIDNIGFQVSIISGAYVARVTTTLISGQSSITQLSIAELISLISAKLGSAATPVVQELEKLRKPA